MGTSIHKVAKEKLHKQNKLECGLATATMEAYIDERLCEEVRKYPHLYNSCMKEYKDIYMGFNSWREIAQTLGKDEAYCRQRWKYICDRYVRATKTLKGRRDLAPLGQERYCNLERSACVRVK